MTRAAKRSATPSSTAPSSASKTAQEVKLGETIGEWDPYTFSLLTEIAGTVQFKDLQEGVTLNEEVDEVTGLSRLVVADSADEKRQPPSSSSPQLAATSATSCPHALTS